MELKIDNKHRITTDDRNYILQEKKIRTEKSKNHGTEYWKDVKTGAYYSTLRNVLNGYKEHQIKQSEAAGVQEIKELLADINKNIEKLISKLDYDKIKNLEINKNRSII